MKTTRYLIRLSSLLIGCLLGVCQVQGQSETNWDEVSFQREIDFTQYLWEGFMPVLKNDTSRCTRAILSIQMSLKSDGSISNYSISPGLPSDLRITLDSLVASSEKYWQRLYSSPQKQAPKEPIVQVASFELATGCRNRLKLPSNTIAHSAYWLFHRPGSGGSENKNYNPNDMPLKAVLLPPVMFTVLKGFSNLDRHKFNK